jgi:hypothetical protein
MASKLLIEENNYIFEAYVAVRDENNISGDECALQFKMGLAISV